MHLETWRQGKQTNIATRGEKVEESSSNHRHTGPLPRAQRLLERVSLTSHLLSSSRDQVRAGTSEEGVLEVEPSAVAVLAAETNRSLGGRAGQGAPRTTSQEEPLPWPLLQLALLSVTQGTTSRDTQEAPELSSGNTGSKWSKNRTGKDLGLEECRMDVDLGLSGSSV